MKSESREETFALQDAQNKRGILERDPVQRHHRMTVLRNSGSVPIRHADLDSLKRITEKELCRGLRYAQEKTREKAVTFGCQFRFANEKSWKLTVPSCKNK